jgi:hypothetical protein
MYTKEAFAWMNRTESSSFNHIPLLVSYQISKGDLYCKDVLTIWVIIAVFTFTIMRQRSGSYTARARDQSLKSVTDEVSLKQHFLLITFSVFPLLLSFYHCSIFSHCLLRWAGQAAHCHIFGLSVERFHLWPSSCQVVYKILKNVMYFPSWELGVPGRCLSHRNCSIETLTKYERRGPTWRSYKFFRWNKYRIITWKYAMFLTSVLLCVCVSVVWNEMTASRRKINLIITLYLLYLSKKKASSVTRDNRPSSSHRNSTLN